MIRKSLIRSITALALLALLDSATLAGELPRLKVCATVPDLGQLAREVGGEDVDVVVFTHGVQDPHFLEAKPSFIKELSRADLYLQVGLELEVGWAPNLYRNARNRRVLPGANGFFDASREIVPIDIPAGIVDRSLGDVHAQGNPHYLVDPLNGLKVARGIAKRLGELRPERQAFFDQRFKEFARKLATALAGEALTASYDPEKLAVLIERDQLEAFLKSRNQELLLGGWLGRTIRLRGTLVAADHNLWPYFLHRFGLRTLGFLEPKPGIAPTTRHLAELVGKAKSEKLRAILTAPYFNERHARLVATETGAVVLAMAHQCGAREGTTDYISLIEYNVRQIEKTTGGP